MELNEFQLRILKDKLPRQEIQRRNLLLELDVAFEFNRTELARFLEGYGLIGYSRSHLYKILGAPVLRAEEHKVLKEVLFRIGEPDLLPLIVRKGVYRSFLSGSLGSMADPDMNP